MFWVPETRRDCSGLISLRQTARQRRRLLVQWQANQVGALQIRLLGIRLEILYLLEKQKIPYFVSFCKQRSKLLLKMSL